MLDHVTFGVSDLARSMSFYDQTLKPLGVTLIVKLGPDVTGGASAAGYGEAGRAFFWIGDGALTRGPVHVAFAAADRAVVDAFHAAGMAAGGRDNGAPGPRPYYHPDYYGAFVLDPDGHNIEAVCRTPA